MASVIQEKEAGIRKIEEWIQQRRAAEEARPVRERQATLRLLTVSEDLRGLQDMPYSPAARQRHKWETATVHLPSVDKVTPVANLLLSTSLFAATRRNVAHRQPLFLGECEVDGRNCSVVYEGPLLTTSHGDVFFECLRHVQRAAFDDWLSMPVRQFLKEVGRCEKSGANHKALERELRDLHMGSFFLEYSEGGRKRVKAAGWRLVNFDVEKFVGDGPLRQGSIVKFSIPSETASLFGLRAWSPVDLALRSRLSTVLQKWLHGYLSTRGSQGNVTLSELHQRSGARQSLPQFRIATRAAVAELIRSKVLADTSYVAVRADKLLWAKTRPRELSRRSLVEVTSS
ncbi:MAG: hypothetical protein KF891_05120 [Rhizobacter sp.]|nr:hypothetical protein [Rhizobacter sp.]